MRALLLADESFAWRERLMLSRLEVGLADIGLTVTRADPEREDRPQSMGSGLTSSSITYRRIGVINSPRAQSQALIDQLVPIKPTLEDSPIDVIHAFGDGCWSLAVDVAQRLGAACAFELWSSHSIGQIPRIERRCDRAGVQLLWLAPDEPIKEAAEAEHCKAPCRVARWGVHSPPVKREWAPSNANRSIAVLSSGSDIPGTIRALEGISRFVRTAPGTLVFLDAKAVADHEKVWRRAEALGLLENLSVIPDMEARRELVLRCDLLLLPEARGEHRTLTLDAMASGMVVIAQRDPLVASLDDPGQVALVDGGESSDWEEAIRGVLTNPERAQSLISSALEFIKKHRRASDHAQDLYDAMAWLIGRDSIQITDAARADRTTKN